MGFGVLVRGVAQSAVTRKLQHGGRRPYTVHRLTSARLPRLAALSFMLVTRRAAPSAAQERADDPMGLFGVLDHDLVGCVVDLLDQTSACSLERACFALTTIVRANRSRLVIPKNILISVECKGPQRIQTSTYKFPHVQKEWTGDALHQLLERYPRTRFMDASTVGPEYAADFDGVNDFLELLLEGSLTALETLHLPDKNTSVVLRAQVEDDCGVTIDAPLTKGMRMLVELALFTGGWTGEKLRSIGCSFKLAQNMSSGISFMRAKITTTGGTKLQIKWSEINGLGDDLFGVYLNEIGLDDIDEDPSHLYDTAEYHEWERAHVNAMHDGIEKDFKKSPIPFLLDSLRDHEGYGGKANVLVTARGSDLDNEEDDDVDVLPFSLAVAALEEENKACLQAAQEARPSWHAEHDTEEYWSDDSAPSHDDEQVEPFWQYD